MAHSSASPSDKSFMAYPTYSGSAVFVTVSANCGAFLTEFVCAAVEATAQHQGQILNGKINAEKYAQPTSRLETLASVTDHAESFGSCRHGVLKTR